MILVMSFPELWFQWFQCKLVQHARPSTQFMQMANRNPEWKHKQARKRSDISWKSCAATHTNIVRLRQASMLFLFSSCIFVLAAHLPAGQNRHMCSICAWTVLQSIHSAVKLQANTLSQDSFELIPTCDTAIWDISFDSWSSHLAIAIPRPYARVLVLRP